MFRIARVETQHGFSNTDYRATGRGQKRVRLQSVRSRGITAGSKQVFRWEMTTWSYPKIMLKKQWLRLCTVQAIAAIIVMMIRKQLEAELLMSGVKS